MYTEKPMNFFEKGSSENCSVFKGMFLVVQCETD